MTILSSASRKSRPLISLTRDAAMRACQAPAREGLIAIKFPFGASGDFANASYAAKVAVFQKYDKRTLCSDPHADARTLASAIPNAQGQSLNVHEFIRQQGWTIRRVNPAIALLLASGRFDSARVYKGDGLEHAGLFYRGMF